MLWVELDVTGGMVETYLSKVGLVVVFVVAFVEETDGLLPFLPHRFQSSYNDKKHE